MICCRHFLIEESLPPLAASSAYQICLHPFVVIFVIRGTVASAYMAIVRGSACVSNTLTISGYTTNHQIKRVSVGFDKNRMNGWAKSRYVPQGYLSIQAVKCIRSIYK